MTTDIATTNSQFKFLNPGSREAKIVASNIGEGQVYESDLPRVGMPAGGATQWSYEDASGNVVNTDAIEGILVASTGRGALWPSQEPSGSRPLLVSNDMRTGYLVGEDFGDVRPEDLDKFLLDEGRYDYAAMSNSTEFGFGAGGGRGKRVKEQVVLAVLQKGEVLPVLVKLGGGSLGAWTKFRKGLKVLPNEAIVSLKLERVSNMAGQKFSRVKPSLVGTLTEAEGEVVTALYTEPLTEMLTRVPGVASPAASSTEEAPF